MSYNTERELLDIQSGYRFSNSAKAFSDAHKKNNKLALEITTEKEEKEKRFYDTQNRQIEILQNKVKQSEESNKKLNDLCDLQQQELTSNRKALKSSRIYNIIITSVSVVSLIVAIIALLK